MKLSNVGKVILSGSKPTYSVKEIKKAAPSASKSIREEVIARRKKQKDFNLINIIKTNIETRITEKIKDILDIRFV